MRSKSIYSAPNVNVPDPNIVNPTVLPVQTIYGPQHLTRPSVLSTNIPHFANLEILDESLLFPPDELEAEEFDEDVYYHNSFDSDEHLSESDSGEFLEMQHTSPLKHDKIHQVKFQDEPQQHRSRSHLLVEDEEDDKSDLQWLP